jgi:hypothetical protein
MIAIIGKEIREHLKWAVLWLVLVGLCAAATVRLQNTGDWQGAESVCSPMFIAVMTFGSAAGGLLLGLLQSLLEMRRSQWAFLVHRPLPRSRIFLAEVLGGLALYFPAMLIPLLGAALWAAAPGHIAGPFEWRMILPSIAFIVAGVVFYLAGLLTGLRPARWYGSRGLGIGAAAVCGIFVSATYEFWQALLVALAGIVVLGAAAWGSFLASGEYRPQPRVTRFALAVSLLAGLFTAGLVVAMIGADVWPQRGYTWSFYWIAKNGQVVRVTQRDGTITSIADPSGNELEEYRDPRIRESFYQSTPPVAKLSSDPRYQKVRYSSSQRYFARFYPSTQVDWYYVLSEDRIRGYSLVTRRCIGSLGPDGFAPADQADATRFAQPLPTSWWTYSGGIMADAHAVYRLDFFAQEVRRLFSTADNAPIIGVAVVTSRSAAEGHSRLAVAIATRDRVELHAMDGTLLFYQAHPFDLGKYRELNVSAVDESYYLLWYAPSPTAQSLAFWKLPEYVLEFSPDGRELKRTELPPLYPSNPEAWYTGLWAALVPLAAAIANVAWAVLLSALGDVDGAVMLANLRREFMSGWSPFLVASFLALAVSIVVCTVLTLWIARRYAFSRQARNWWALLAFLGGPAALLLLAALRDWPARENCSACGQKRVVDREECEHCGAPYPAPVADGTEIYER